MALHSLIEAYYDTQTGDFAKSSEFQKLESGRFNVIEIDEFIHNLCRSHLKSPQILAFLYAIAPPDAAGALQHNQLDLARNIRMLLLLPRKRKCDRSAPIHSCSGRLKS